MLESGKVGGSVDQLNQQRLSDFGSQSEVDLETLKEAEVEVREGGVDSHSLRPGNSKQTTARFTPPALYAHPCRQGSSWLSDDRDRSRNPNHFPFDVTTKKYETSSQNSPLLAQPVLPPETIHTYPLPHDALHSTTTTIKRPSAQPRALWHELQAPRAAARAARAPRVRQPTHDAPRVHAHGRPPQDTRRQDVVAAPEKHVQRVGSFAGDPRADLERGCDGPRDRRAGARGGERCGADDRREGEVA